MTSKEAIAKIRAMFVGEDPAAAGDTAPATEFKEYTTDAGVVVSIDKLEVGGKVMQADGVTPVAGDIVLADGTMVGIDANGIITAVTVPADAALAAVPAAQFQAMEQKFTAQHESFTAQIAKVEEARKADALKFKQVVDGLLDIVQKFADEPSADPAQAPADKSRQPGKKERAMNIVTAAKQKVAAQS